MNAPLSKEPKAWKCSKCGAPMKPAEDEGCWMYDCRCYGAVEPMYRFDGRQIRLARDEAEYLVDCLERERIPQWMMLAAEIRENWGMCTFEREQEQRDIETMSKLLHL